MVSQWIASACLLFGALIGLRSMLWPRWGADIVGLRPMQDRPEGQSEFRATYGGLFFFSHLVTLVLLWRLDQLSSPIVCIPISAAWFGAGAGRILSVLRDGGAATRLNFIWIATEFGMALGIVLPFLMMLRLIHILG